MARRMESFDWPSCALGSPVAWDSALKTLVPVMLASNQPMFVVWGPTRALLYNDAYACVLADKDPEALGRDFLDVWHELRAELEPLVSTAYAGQPCQANDIELWTVRRGYREEAHFSYFYAPVRNEQGLVHGFFCACNENTAQIAAERELAEREARHRGVLENMVEGFVLLNADFRVLEVNDAALRLLNLSRHELVGSNHWERFPNTYDSPFGEMYRRVFATRRPARIEHPYTFPDGREVWFEVRCFPVGAELAVLFEDVTERKRLREEFAVSFERVQLALDAGAIVGTWVWNIPEDRVYGDERFASSFGLDPVSLKAGLPISLAFDAIHEEDRARVREAVADSVAHGTGYRCQYRVFREGAYRWVEAIGRVEIDGQGRPERFPGVLLDVQDRRLIEAERDRMVEALRHADRRKDEFLAMLAHELRNPLAPIKTAAQVLGMLDSAPGQVSQLSAMISRQVEHMARLVDDLLDVSRVTRGMVQIKQQRVELAEVVKAGIEQVSPMLQAKGHQLRCVITPEPCVAQGDFHRLVQVVVNLLGNAVKYTPPGGTIEVTLSTTGEHFVLAIRDNGMGLAPDMRDEVFSLFVQASRTPDRSQGGLGIGLALVRALVKLHGGTVRAESAGLGSGSTFVVELPSPGHVEEDGRRSVPAAVCARVRRLMVVDDNRDAAESLAMMLRIDGHGVNVAHDGRSALALLDQEPRWDAFILDIGLPDMTGYELATRIRSEPSAQGATFIALTGYGQPSDRESAEAAGFHHHLVKPAGLAALMSVLAQIESEPVR